MPHDCGYSPTLQKQNTPEQTHYAVFRIVELMRVSTRSL
ncbi:hypothetical protein SPHINGOT1_460014 [Sphingomonas sp. T1]|nr:hypothetical protein SPHINGOT1_460014 [Sphingomonas sp. T1]